MTKLILLPCFLFASMISFAGQQINASSKAANSHAVDCSYKLLIGTMAVAIKAPDCKSALKSAGMLLKSNLYDLTEPTPGLAIDPGKYFQ